MSEVVTTLELLIDGLNKKLKALTEVYEYTVAQEKLLDSEDFKLKTFNNIMKNKQFRIDAVSKIDDGFEPSYERIRVHLEKSPDLYREHINQMKALIKEIGDVSVSIQVLEEKNHAKFKVVTSGLKNEVKTFRKSKKTVTNYYNNFNKQAESVRKNLYDTKK